MAEGSRHATEVLELAAALEVVAGYAASDLGRDAVRGLQPTSDVGAVASELELVAEGARLVGGEGGWVLPGIPNLVDPLIRLRLEGYVWFAPDFLDASRLLSASSSTRKHLLANRDRVPGLAAIAELLVELPAVVARIGKVVGDDGEVSDGASPELGRLRREIQGARGRIVQKLTEYAASLPSQLQVSDASISIRDGRYVVPVRREGRSEVGGIVHGESQSGATLFIEPPVAIELMNRLRELEAAEAREVHRILRELTDELRPHAEEISGALDALVRIDSIHARARYAEASDAHLPKVVDPEGGELDIVQGRHPLLLAAGEGVVAFDLRMEPGERTLVISGPNTGGKTVLLKALGLISLLTRCGIIPPVGPGSTVPIVDQVFADIGDEQSIEASLSTFSAHLKNLRETLADADGRSMVLVDEVGSGTDPVEGAALARAIIVDLTDRSAFTVATTHLGSLKLLAAEDERIVNASLQFDAEKLEPTYRLLKGIPGQSYGLAIARRLGLPAEILDAAEAALPAGERDVGKLLLDLEAKEQRVAAMEADLDRLVREAEAKEAELRGRESDLTQREKDAERRARQQARDLLLQSRSEVEAAIQEVRSVNEDAEIDEAARAARRKVEEAARRQREKTPSRSAPKERKAVPDDLEVGARVRVESLGRTAKLLELRDTKATVDMDGMRMQLSASDLTMLPPGDQASPKQTSKRSRGAMIDADMDASPEVDLRGLRVEDLGLQLGRALDRAIVAGLPSFRIIHGKGTGALRAEVHDLLTEDPRINTFRPGERYEGGTGVTVVEFG